MRMPDMYTVYVNPYTRVPDMYTVYVNPYTRMPDMYAVYVNPYTRMSDMYALQAASPRPSFLLPPDRDIPTGFSYIVPDRDGRLLCASVCVCVCVCARAPTHL